ncbi:MAG: hypothetical protein HQL39_05110 [Alphaproteobacteria bacterium]|nr:hypothetical protein [Alphaproteobacteria bacterium]
MIDEDMDRLLGFHRRRYWLTNGWSVWIRAWAVEPSTARPHGIRYSFSLHDVDGTRILGYDNAHAIPQRVEHDHWHRFRRMGRRVPYEFVDADTLLADFFSAVRRICEFENVSYEIDEEDLIGDEEVDDVEDAE